jgi:hypothetical protein
METGDYWGSLYVKSYHDIGLNTSDSLGDQLCPWSLKRFKMTNLQICRKPEQNLQRWQTSLV